MGTHSWFLGPLVLLLGDNIWLFRGHRKRSSRSFSKLALNLQDKLPSGKSQMQSNSPRTETRAEGRGRGRIWRNWPWGKQATKQGGPQMWRTQTRGGWGLGTFRKKAGGGALVTGWWQVGSRVAVGRGKLWSPNAQGLAPSQFSAWDQPTWTGSTAAQCALPGVETGQCDKGELGLSLHLGPTEENRQQLLH